MKVSTTGRVDSNKPAGTAWARIEIEAPDIAAGARPGQFLQLRAWEGSSPLLRRPFSIAGVRDSRYILLLVKVRGAATRIISGLDAGSSVELIGPLGTSFDPAPESEPVFLVAGGVGVAPLRFFIQHTSGGQARPTLFFGSYDSGEAAILDDDLFSGITVVQATEDGSAGTKGFVTEALAHGIKADAPAGILVCGPAPMMRETVRIAGGAGVPCMVSLETYMGCGIGACMGCAVPAAGGGYFHACTEGPVVDASRIDWKKI